MWPTGKKYKKKQRTYSHWSINGICSELFDDVYDAWEVKAVIIWHTVQTGHKHYLQSDNGNPSKHQTLTQCF